MPVVWGFPVGSVVKNLPAMQEMWVWSLGREDPLENKMATHSSILAYKIHEERSLVGYSPWGHRVRRWLSGHTHTPITLPTPQFKVMPVKCLQTLPPVFWGQSHLQLRTIGLEGRDRNWKCNERHGYSKRKIYRIKWWPKWNVRKYFEQKKDREYDHRASFWLSAFAISTIKLPRLGWEASPEVVSS